MDPWAPGSMFRVWWFGFACELSMVPATVSVSMSRPYVTWPCQRQLTLAAIHVTESCGCFPCFVGWWQLVPVDSSLPRIGVTPHVLVTASCIPDLVTANANSPFLHFVKPLFKVFQCYSFMNALWWIFFLAACWICSLQQLAVARRGETEIAGVSYGKWPREESPSPWNIMNENPKCRP